MIAAAPSTDNAPADDAPTGDAPTDQAPTDDAPTGDDVVRLRLALARLARQQRRVDPTGLTPSQQSALAVIDRWGPLPLGEVARIENVAPPTITRIVGKLEAQGLVERTADPDDRRVARVSITETGHTRMAETRDRRNRWFTAKMASLAPADAEALARVIGPLERLVDAEPSTDPAAVGVPAAEATR